MSTLADYDEKIALFTARSQHYAAKATTLREEGEKKRAAILEQTAKTYADLAASHTAIRDELAQQEVANAAGNLIPAAR